MTDYWDYRDQMGCYWNQLRSCWDSLGVVAVAASRSGVVALAGSRRVPGVDRESYGSRSTCISP